jgi:hypothetical protein
MTAYAVLLAKLLQEIEGTGRWWTGNCPSEMTETAQWKLNPLTPNDL